MSFRLSEVNYEGVCLIKVEGSLQGDSSSAAFRALFSRRVQEGIRYFVIDISEMNYISSVGLADVAAVRMRLSLRVSKYGFILPSTSSTKQLREVFETTGMFSVLNFYETLPEAFSEFLGRPVDSTEVVSKLEERLSIDSNEKVTDSYDLLQSKPTLTEEEKASREIFAATGKKPAQLRKIQIFLASSAELREDRDEFEIYFRQLNDELLEKGIYLVIYRWENFLDAMSETRLQDEYNKAVRTCDIFVSLFATKTGRFTEEEFNTAHQQFQNTGKPHIYTFFKDVMIHTNNMQEEDLLSLMAFKKRLKDLGHFYTPFANSEDLKLRFRSQLDKLLDGPLRT